MQKKIIALAVAGLVSGAAFAQTNVTIYGIADAGYVYNSGDAGGLAGTAQHGTNKFSGIQSGAWAGSRLGFKGEEALGNGLKAVFTLEYGLAIDGNAGVGTALARQQFVGLSSASMGTLSLGRQYAPGFAAMARNDSWAGTTYSPVNVLAAAGGNTIHTGNGSRWNNSVAYATPNLSGFTVSAIYGFGENANGGYNNASTTDNGSFGLGLNYANGPFNADLIYQSRLNVANPAAAGAMTPALYNVRENGFGDNVNEWYLGAAYDFKVVKAYASYQALSDKNSTKLDNKLWSLGLSAPIGQKGLLMATYARLTFDQSSSAATGGAIPLVPIALANRLTDSSDSFGIAYTHSLSKRTKLYTGITYTDNDKKSRAVSGSTLAGIGAANETNTLFTAGLSHAF